jgi:hypothetical protein
MNDTHGDECLIRVDTACLEVMKEELRKDDLLLKEDIVNYNLLYHSCHPMSMRFAEWDPDSLITDTYEDLPLGHAIIKSTDITHFHHVHPKCPQTPSTAPGITVSV